MASKTKKKKKKAKVIYTAVEEKLVLPFNILLANKFLNAIGFVDFIDRSVEWDPKQWNVSPGNLAKAVILVTFLQVRAPLYHIKNSFVGVDTEALFGEGVMPEHLDALSRVLDRISKANPEGLFSSLCLSLYSIYNIEKSEVSAEDILRQYKEQSIVEVEFKLLKEPALAPTIFLKTPERINALVMLLNISLLIWALVQYKIRKNIKESKEELPRIGRNKEKLENPTIKYILEILPKIHLVRVDEDTYEYVFLMNTKSCR